MVYLFGLKLLDWKLWTHSEGSWQALEVLQNSMGGSLVLQLMGCLRWLAAFQALHCSTELAVGGLLHLQC